MSHGEGRAYFPDEVVLKCVKTEGLVIIRYVAEDGEVKQRYMANPKGSSHDSAGVR